MNKVYGCGLKVDKSYGPICEGQANKHPLYYRKIGGVIKNDYVLWLQNRLCELGYILTKDRKFGPETKRIVGQFKIDRGLVNKKGKPDYCVGPNTVKELLR